MLNKKLFVSTFSTSEGATNFKTSMFDSLCILSAEVPLVLYKNHILFLRTKNKTEFTFHYFYKKVYNV